MVRHNAAARFVLGKSGQRLAYSFMAHFPIRDLALPYLQQLTLLSGHSSSLFIRLGWYAVRIALISGTSSIVNVAPIGEARPLTMGAPSLAMLAQVQRSRVHSRQRSRLAGRPRSCARQCERVCRAGLRLAGQSTGERRLRSGIPLGSDPTEIVLADYCDRGADRSAWRNSTRSKSIRRATSSHRCRTAPGAEEIDKLDPSL